MIKKYVKKPKEVYAVQWCGSNTKEVTNFMLDQCDFAVNHTDNSITIFTLEGKMKASLCDYIIRGVAGEFYPCKPDIFHDTYQEVTE